MQKICDVNAEAKEKLPPAFKEKSGVGTHYVDAYVKPMNLTLEDGTKVACKRRGLQVNLSYGDKKGGRQSVSHDRRRDELCQRVVRPHDTHCLSV